MNRNEPAAAALEAVVAAAVVVVVAALEAVVARHRWTQGSVFVVWLLRLPLQQGWQFYPWKNGFLSGKSVDSAR